MKWHIKFTNRINIGSLRATLPITWTIRSKRFAGNHVNVGILNGREIDEISIYPNKAKFIAEKQETAINLVNSVLQYTPEISIAEVKEKAVLWSYSFKGDYLKNNGSFQKIQRFRDCIQNITWTRYVLYH